MSEELKLCPFCGKAHPTRVGRGIVYRNDDLATKEVAENYQHAITFLDGGLPCPFSLLVVTAEQWNTRPLEDAQTAEIARLQSELQQARERERWKPIDVMPDTDGEIVADLYRGERRNV